MTNFIKILRWLLFLPISLLGGWLLFYVVFYVLDMSTGGNAAPDSIISYFNDIAAGGLSGAATVYIGVYIAPSYEEKVAIGYAVITLIGALLTLAIYPFVLLDDLSYIAQNVGMLYMAWNIYRRKVVFEKQ